MINKNPRMLIDTSHNEIWLILILEATIMSITNLTSNIDKTNLPTTDETNSMTIDDTKPSRPKRIRTTLKYLQD